VLAERIGATTAAEEALAHSRPLMLAAELLAAASALVLPLGAREPRAPLTIAICVPDARTVSGLRAVDLTWGSRPLD
jgi:hypothetical protein